MGVPKFYRWISERYPKINQIVTDSALLPEFDHLYLDMNGIIHGCTHPPGQDVSEILSERDMMMGIMHYLDRIITQIVKPKVSVYMAIDGVAPRAKLNQQRSRRFRSARDMAEALEDMDDDNGNKKHVFDSNCITPGTEFLAQVSEIIRFFIRKKIKEDPAWRNLTVIFSGHDIPGEGEHKIMDHIRQLRSQPDYQPNTRHCIYGQDADLIMLGLVTHEPHFTILRETVNFNFNRGGENSLKEVKKFTKESDFQLLHLSVLREYLAIEFCLNQPQAFDLERCIDDFVFLTFLVGNDFLPHLPTLDIGDGAFDMLFSLYKDLRLGWGEGNYLTQEGQISDPLRLEGFIAAIGVLETDILKNKEKDEAVYLKKKRKWDKRDGKAEGPTDAELEEVENSKQQDFQTVIDSMLAKHGTDPDNFVEGWQPVSNPGEKDFKGRYYFEKLDFKPTDKDKHWHLRKSYMEGLMWCLAYYYRGCISWGWYYPYHYGPMLSDLIGIPKMFGQISFEIGEALTPFEQLMACLPPGSSVLVPKLYRWLMTQPESPIIRFYPENFQVDMNGKKNPWEGVNLLPFIDIKELKDTIAKHCPDSKLSAVERQRNALGKVYAYRFDSSCIDKVEAPNKKIGLADITASCSSASVVEEPTTRSPAFKPKLIHGTRIPYPGFPSLNVLPIVSVDHVAIGLNCFGSPSKYPTCLLTLAQMPELPPLLALAGKILGQSLFVNWPMMHEGRVVAISDEVQEIRLVSGQPKAKAHTEALAERWRSDTEALQQSYYVGDGSVGSGGVNIGEVKIRLKLLPLQGMKTNPANGSTKKVFGREEADVPLQLALFVAPAPDPRFQERGPLSLKDRFSVSCSVVLTKGKYRGCLGEVVGFADAKTVAVKVQTVPAEIPFGVALARTVQESFISSNDAAKILRIHPGLLGKIAGRLPFEQGRYDLGLNLKSSDGTCVVGYTRKRVEHEKKSQTATWSAGDALRIVGSKRDEENGDRIIWEYTPKAIRLIEAYRTKFPQLFAGIAKLPNERKYDANAIFGPNGESWLPVIREWLNNLDSAKLPRSPVTTQSMSNEAVAAVQKAADVRTLALKKRGYPKESFIKIPGGALYREGSTGATDILVSSDMNGGESPQLGDRIINLAAEGIPFGLRGTVVGIHEAATTGSVEVVMDEEFIGGTTLQGMCSKFRGKLCLWSRLLKIAPDDTKNLVDKLVPKGSGKAAVDKIISSIDPAAKASLAEVQAAAPQAKAPQNAWQQEAKPKGQDQKARTPTEKTNSTAAASRPSSAPARPASKGRAGSAQKHRQGGWREAQGPDEKGTGFKWKGSRKRKPGLACWRKKIGSNRESVATEKLKNTLGLLQSPAVQTDAAVDSAADQLKAVLGVSSPRAGKPEAETQPTASKGTAQLKAALGVGQNTQAPPPAPRAPESRTAADKLMQMMASSAPQPHPMMMNHPHPPPPPPHPMMGHPPHFHPGHMPHPSQMGPPMGPPMPPPQFSGFNFTYVEQGAPMPGPPPPHMHPQPMYAPPHPMMMPYPMAGSPPQPAMMAPNNNGGAGPVSDYEFPPLGASAPPPPVKPQKVESSAPVALAEAKKEKTSTNGNGSFMVPSTVVRR